MSVTITTDVFCDINGDACHYWVHGVTGPRTATKAARRVAAVEGWVHRGGLDICPGCQSKDPR